MELASTWEVIFHDEFDPEFDAFSVEVQNQLMAAAKAVESLGPAADRPHVGTLSNPRHPNMKELRFDTHQGAQVWRAAFAFDPQRHAIVLVLVAAAKQGTSEQKFNKALLKKANQRYDSHLNELKRRAASAAKPGKK